MSNDKTPPAAPDAPPATSVAPQTSPVSAPARFWSLAGAGLALAVVATYIALTSHHWITLPLGAGALVLTSLAGRHPRLGNGWTALPVLLVGVACFALLLT